MNILPYYYQNCEKQLNIEIILLDQTKKWNIQTCRTRAPNPKPHPKIELFHKGRPKNHQKLFIEIVRPCPSGPQIQIFTVNKMQDAAVRRYKAELQKVRNLGTCFLTCLPTPPLVLTFSEFSKGPKTWYFRVCFSVSG